MKRRWLVVCGASLAGCSLLPQAPYVQQRAWPLDIERPSIEFA